MARQKKKRKREIRLLKEMHVHGTSAAAASGWAANQASKRERNKSGRRGWHSGTRMSVIIRSQNYKEISYAQEVKDK